MELKNIIDNYFLTERSVLQEFIASDLKKRNIQLYIKRDDLIHSEVSGNKWRKLKYSLLQAQHEKSDGILTFGGAYSNHLLATASACNALSLNCIGIVRGEELTAESNSTLKRCQELGMKLVFIDRMLYNLRNDSEYLKELRIDYPGFYIIPEGGANYFGMIGCQEIWNELPQDLNHIFVAQGTSTTSCGLLLGLPKQTKLHVIPVLKGYDSIAEMKRLLYLATFDHELSNEMLQSIEVHVNYHFGGYGQHNQELISFINQIYQNHNLPLDHVYTAKAFYGLLKEIEDQKYNNTKVLFLHTGGLQGSIVKFDQII